MAIEKTISHLVKEQFPDFYRTDGPVFVDFVTKYYEWLEGTSTIATKSFAAAKGQCRIKVTSGSANIETVNSTSSPTLLTCLSNGDSIAIYKNETDYELFTVNNVVNNSFLYLTSNSLPDFSAANTRYSGTKSQNNPLYYSRRMYDDNDIDLVSEDLLVYFKEKYLKMIKFDTLVDLRTIIKHCLDIYQSKGSERSVELLYRAVFGTEVDVYYPQNDLFKPSSGHWFIPKYLEISLNNNSNEYLNKQITGVISGATAFVDSVVRKNSKNKLIDVLYISSIAGNFVRGEKLQAEGLDLLDSSIVLGSLNSITISDTDTSNGFSIGDILTITSSLGGFSTGRVNSVANSTGTVDFSLLNGGYGYTANSNIYISEKVLTISNVAVNTSLNGTKNFYELFSDISQPFANINYISATGSFSIGDGYFTYHANGDPDGIGTILSVTESNSTAGFLQISIQSGNAQSNDTFYNDSNAVSANHNPTGGYNDLTATANVLGWYSNVVVTIDTVVGTFDVGETVSVFSTGSNGYLSSVDGTNLHISNTYGLIARGTEVQGLTSGATGNVTTVQISLGVKDISNNTFQVVANNYLVSNTYQTIGTVTAISTGSGANASITGNLLYTEYASINNNYIRDYLTMDIANNAYGIPGDPTGNLSTNTIANILSYANVELGRIANISVVGTGDTYNRNPVIRIYDDITTPSAKAEGWTLDLTGTTGTFDVGELVTQNSGSARGFVVSSNSSEMLVQNLRWSNNFLVTSNSTTQIVGTDSGTVANITSLAQNNFSNIYGDDAVISQSISSSNGSLVTVDVTDSGFGFVDGETVNLASGSSLGFGIANVTNYGTGAGFYKSKGAFPSDDSRIHDGVYWQALSYEIRSSVINKFKGELQNLIHPAGTKYFDKIVYNTSNPITITSETEKTVA